jgi:broad specificity phosphatase PhoE
MYVYLIRHAETDSLHTPDPYTVPLTESGREQAEAVAGRCAAWGIDFMVTSVMRSAQETADAIMARLPQVERWDLEDLEEMTIDDLLGLPTGSPLVSRWTPEQLQLGRERTWIRTMAVLSRVMLYAEANNLDRVAIVAGDTVLSLLLLNWMELDWRALDRLSFRFDPASSSLVELSAGHPEIIWINRPTRV